MQINSFLLSFFWIETHLELLESEQPKDARMKFLGRPDAYATEFKEAQYRLRVNDPSPLLPPWMPRTRGQHFWTYYCGGTTNTNVTGSMAWQKLVPFQALLPLRLDADATLSLPRFELFFYPYGIAVGITLTWKDESSQSLENALDAAFVMRFGRQYRVAWEGEEADFFSGIAWPNEPGRPLSMIQLAENGLNVARTLAYGKEGARGKITKPDPFSVFTCLNGKDVDVSKAAENNGNIQKCLHAVTNWQKIREGAADLVLDEEVKVGLGEEAGVADILYGQRRGRAIWYPSRFITNDPNILFGLQCYHRNIFSASMQTESLCGYAQAAVERLQSGADLSVYQREVASKAGGNLGLLFGGHPDTYRSLSPRRQIQDNDWVEAVNALRTYRGMLPLH